MIPGPFHLCAIYSAEISVYALTQNMRRVLAISDLHIGGEHAPMLGHPELLHGFLGRFAALDPVNDELELVIHGDFIDFLAEEPYAAWTGVEAEAEAKLAAVFARNTELFDALARCAQPPRRLTLLLGNHDVELALPRVRAALLRRLGSDPHHCYFVQNNECYCVGDLLIEHGNRYDTWNAIDHDGLREAVSCLSRGAVAPRGAPELCPGSQLVEEVINPLRRRYHFIDLLKPEDKAVALLLLTFEPKLLYRLSMVWGLAANYLRNYWRELQWTAEPEPQARRFLGSEPAPDRLPPELAEAFGPELDQLARQPLGAAKPRPMDDKPDPDSLAALLQRDALIPEKRLEKLRLSLRTALAGDLSYAKGDSSGPYATAARRMIECGAARVVVMGHTHLQRDVEWVDLGGRYLNTGTWADLVCPDHDALADQSPGRPRFVAWLKRLASNDLAGIRVCEPGFADVSTDSDGRVVSAHLRTYKGEPL